MALRLAATARNAACDAIVDLIDAGAGAGTLVIRTGTQPANPQTAATGTTLATLTFSDPAFGNSAAGVATANAITSDTNVDATGTAGWARVYDSDGADPGDVPHRPILCSSSRPMDLVRFARDTDSGR